MITGNSHAGAMRVAWNAMPERPAGVEVDFLNITAEYFAQFHTTPDGRYGLVDESLVPSALVPMLHQINGAIVRNLPDYSHVLIAGCLRTNDILRLLAAHRVDDIREAPLNRPRLSQAAYLAFSLAIAMNHMPVERIAALSPWCKVALSLAPRPSHGALVARVRDPFYKALGEDTTGIRAALALTETALDRRITAEGATLFPMPEASLAASGLTLESYSQAPILIPSGATPQNGHMNADYGALCLGPILDWVRA